jgi:N-terminal conserved domain of Nudc./CS domain
MLSVRIATSGCDDNDTRLHFARKPRHYDYYETTTIMSLPFPSTSRQSHPINPDDFAEFEQPLMELARRSKGDLRRLLTAFFGFLHRRTDFYCVTSDGGETTTTTTMGFPMGDAEKLLLASFRQFPLRKVGAAPAPPSSSQQHEEQPAITTAAPRDFSKDGASKPSTTSDKAASSTINGPSSISPEEATIKESEKSIPVAPMTEPTTTTTTAASITRPPVRWTEEGLQIPVGNGGSTDQYQWTQTLEEITVLVPVDGSLRGKNLLVVVSPTALSIQSKSPLRPPDETEPKVYVSGALSAAIDPNESTWSLEGGVVQVILYKSVPTFWSHVLQGDAEIDTDLVDNRRDIHSYDETTQAKLRQVMFDQGQMAKGLPTSDQLQKKIPPLPPGVEYINQEVLDKATAAAAATATVADGKEKAKT